MLRLVLSNTPTADEQAEPLSSIKRGTSASELDFSSPALPGGTLVAALYDRTFMQLSDRGRASNSIGDRWAELCAEALDVASASPQRIRTGPDEILATMTVRLDHIPAIARIASRNQLQNPDFLMLGTDQGSQVLWAADAKFSVETARSRQVSHDVVEGLLGLGDIVRGLLPSLPDDLVVRNGVFVCPDYPLTHRILTERHGPRRATVSTADVRLLPVCPPTMFDPLGQVGLQHFFAATDAFPYEREATLLVALYYFRLARAALGCWLDQISPLLAYRDVPTVDEDAVEAEARRIAAGVRTSAWGIIRRWNDEAEAVRRQRAAVEQVTALPVRNKLLRARIESSAARAGVEPPSMSRVRRMLGSWYRQRLREDLGPMMPPVADFGAALETVGRVCRSLERELDEMTDRIIEDVLTTPESGPVETS
ncbi:MAG TPA: hypothetical protein VD767_01580 [Thermomicrobiales bacterium]|nr:hypothetical protein [Thermomicrobiales bacterium]